MISTHEETKHPPNIIKNEEIAPNNKGKPTRTAASRSRKLITFHKNFSSEGDERAKAKKLDATS